MKPKSVSRTFAKILIVALTLAAPPALAATWHWDGGIADKVANSAIEGGVGTWNTALINWTNSPGTTVSAWVGGSDAVFGTTGGTVTLGATPISAGDLNFATTGYTLSLGNNRLNATSLSGSAATISGNASSIFALTNSLTVTWNGTLTPGTFIKTGAGTLNFSGNLSPSGSGGIMSFEGGKTDFSGGTTTLGGATFQTSTSGTEVNLGNNTFAGRKIIVGYGSKVTTAGTARLRHNAQFDYLYSYGLLDGSLGVEFAHNGVSTNSSNISGVNTHTGGTYFTSAVAGSSTLNVHSNTALGTGKVAMTANTTNQTATIKFMSETPTIGSLESSGIGAKNIVLGAAVSSGLQGKWNSGSDIITLSAAGASHQVAVGQAITGSAANGIPSSAVITEIISDTQFRISVNATITKTANTALTANAANTTLSIGVLNTDTSFAGVISQATGTTGGITKTGAGKFSLLGAASYTGTTTVSDGILIVGSGAAQTTASVNTTNANNSITYTTLPTGLGVGQSITGTNIPASTTVVAIDVANKKVYMSANATATGSTTPSFGAWQSLPTATNVVLGTSTTNGTLDLNNSTQRIVSLSVGVGATAADQKVGNGSTVGDATLETTGTSVFAGVISDTLTTGNKKTNLSVVSGSLTLSGTSTYTGTTTVSAGTLIVNGNISTSTLTTVNGTGTIGGGGTVGDLTIATGGTHNPGNSPGIMNTGDYTMAGSLNIEAIGNTPGVGGYDQVNVTGTINLSGTLNTLFTGGTYANGDLLFILLNDDSDAVSGTFSSLAQNAFVVNYGGFDWNISYTANSTGNTFTGGNDVALMAIPEPNAAALIGGFGILALLRRRRM
jgi:fibronectin-binding autotransporter adhesin